MGGGAGAVGMPIHVRFRVADLLDPSSFPFARQVQNKLDGCCYAVKRIPINPASRHFRRIKGEVTLLSRLHHENIVRYYNAWIERHERPAGPATPPPNSGPQAQDRQALAQPAGDSDPDGPGSVEAAAPPPILSSSVEWSTSGERSASIRFPAAGPDSSSDEDDDEEEQGVFSQSFL